MELFCIEYENNEIKLVGSSWAGQEAIYLNERKIEVEHDSSGANAYEFEIPGIGKVRLEFIIDDMQGKILVRLTQGLDILIEHQQILKTPEQIHQSKPRKPEWHLWAWIGIALKLLKSVKVVQVALVGMSLSAWGIFFSWEFAFAIVGILVFHEYGHLWAMKKCGIPTKGIYLIPFVGGVAIGDRARSHWQEVYVSMMGPFFGLAMTLLFAVVYYFTENHFVGLVASVGALVNLFNMLPVLPLDGGRVFKALALSGQRKAGLVTVTMLTLTGLAIAFKLGLGLLIFFLILGFVDLLASWREFKLDPLIGMDRYGILFSLVWYVITAGLFLSVIILMANTGLPGTELAASILRE